MALAWLDAWWTVSFTWSARVRDRRRSVCARRAFFRRVRSAGRVGSGGMSGDPVGADGPESVFEGPAEFLVGLFEMPDPGGGRFQTAKQ